MSTASPPRAVVVEEELLLVGTTARPSAPVPRERVATRTPAVHDLDELRAALAAGRRRHAACADGRGAVLVASGTELVAGGTDRFRASGADTRAPALTCGCSVRVETGSREEGVAVAERIGPWLPVLLAISANSPFWRGADTDYASYRTQLRGQAPAVVVAAASGPSEPAAIDVRVADVPIEVDDAVLVAALARALVETAARRWREGRPPPPVRTEVARLATWRASRSGLAAALVDVTGRRPVPARVMVNRLVAHAQDALDEAGDLGLVQELVADLAERGTGAARQRDAYRDRGRLEDVVRMLADRTAPLALVP
ncbi:MAG TPA: glutamate-cysteine ligase family protein [Kineosporiaceae bacterium]|nr:glutamate-cysteine ligase family protein [Kineosporiaceae bacterium]